MIEELLGDLTKITVKKICGKSVSPYLPHDILDAINKRSQRALVAKGIMTFFEIGEVGDLVSAGLIWKMYADINESLGISFSKNLLKSVASGVVANVGAFLVAGNLAAHIPGYGQTFAPFVEGTLEYAIVVTSAYIYLKALNLLIDRHGKYFTEEQAKSCVDSYMNSHQNEIRSFVQNVAKKKQG
jgi:hypothetical protein